MGSNPTTPVGARSSAWIRAPAREAGGRGSESHRARCLSRSGRVAPARVERASRFCRNRIITVRPRSHTPGRARTFTSGSKDRRARPLRHGSRGSPGRIRTDIVGARARQACRLPHGAVWLCDRCRTGGDPRALMDRPGLEPGTPTCKDGSFPISLPARGWRGASRPRDHAAAAATRCWRNGTGSRDRRIRRTTTSPFMVADRTRAVPA